MYQLIVAIAIITNLFFKHPIYISLHKCIVLLTQVIR